MSGPSIREIAALTARLRALTAAGADADAAERAAFLADKDALIARITAADEHRRHDQRSTVTGAEDDVSARAPRDPLERARHAVDALPDPAPALDAAERERRDRLALWHTDDHAAADGGDADAAGWSR